MMISDYNSMRSNSSFSSLSLEERRIRSSFNFTSARSFIFSERYSLKALHLPPSIENIDNLPNGLWNWIHSQDSVSQESLNSTKRNGTKIIFNNEKLVNGKLVQRPDLSFPRSISNLYSKSSLLSLNSLSSVSTKIDEPFTNSSLYIQGFYL
ncbi:hypothetical protein LY90DRAFT_515950 [Neocallimastix californiae]|uniref:Uncharacterized protein n=1 Tax=Neocallimastix californiae TaxID=1754190 RepID=A0A1Y2AGJ2_9FUNG|nr:hypothetical protein LY90DRAFT_515950 [Neocallimastix californiae]|eukprot:ORY21728.1 hypothetical protein LY90DRAFT_515950 [Neocallimastix californiae]